MEGPERKVVAAAWGAYGSVPALFAICDDGAVFYSANGSAKWTEARPVPGTEADTSEVDMSPAPVRPSNAIMPDGSTKEVSDPADIAEEELGGRP